jgi:hypothetical protein
MHRIPSGEPATPGIPHKLRTGGKRYQISEGDGLFYSYSVYDSYEQVAQWADRILILPSGAASSKGWFHPLLTTEGAILIGLREPPDAEKVA